MKNKIFYISLSLILLCSCKPSAQEHANDQNHQTDIIHKSQEEWKTLLSEDAYNVLREKGTERAFTGKYWDNKKSGKYLCGGCNLPLFNSDTKYKSGSGWPSFFEVIDPKNIKKTTDYDLGYARTELCCSRCGGHLGHVFDDGPKPTGQRYCINSVSLEFSPIDSTSTKP